MDINDIKIIIDDTINYIEKKYPNEGNTNDRWLALIGEEYGELCMAINDGEINNVIEEGTQTCAAIILMLRDFVKKNALRNEDVDKDLKCYALKDRKGVVHYIKAKDKASAIRKYKDNLIAIQKYRKLKDYSDQDYAEIDAKRQILFSGDGLSIDECVNKVKELVNKLQSDGFSDYYSCPQTPSHPWLGGTKIAIEHLPDEFNNWHCGNGFVMLRYDIYGKPYICFDTSHKLGL